jgi:ABC1 atypical kinase-like domain
VQQAFGAPISELFDEFGKAPVASGSIGQIHRAVLSKRGAHNTGVAPGAAGHACLPGVLASWWPSLCSACRGSPGLHVPCWMPEPCCLQTKGAGASGPAPPGGGGVSTASAPLRRGSLGLGFFLGGGIVCGLLRPLPSCLSRSAAAGTRVAVKVRHPGVGTLITRDFGLMMWGAQLASLLPGTAHLRLEESLKQFAAPLREQVSGRRRAPFLLLDFGTGVLQCVLPMLGCGICLSARCWHLLFVGAATVGLSCPQLLTMKLAMHVLTHVRVGLPPLNVLRLTWRWRLGTCGSSITTSVTPRECDSPTQFTRWFRLG